MHSQESWRDESLGVVLAGIDAGWSPACIERAPSTGQWGILKVSAVTTGRFKRDEAKTLPDALSPRAEIAVKRGDVIMARANGVAALVGMTAQVCEDIERLMLSDKLLRLNPKPQLVTHDYLASLMLSFDVRAQLDRVLSGSSGQRNISQTQVRALRVRLPPLPEQARIAEILDTLDETIRKTEQLIAKLKQVKQGLLHDLLTRGIDDNGELRDPDRQLAQFKDSLVGRLPKTWEVKPLDDVVDPARPIAYGILMPGTGYPGGVPVIKVKDIIGGRVRLDGLLLTSPALDYEYRRSRVKTGDLLFTIRGTVGRMAIVPPQLESANITQDTARIAVRGANVSFVRQYLEMAKPQHFIGVHTLGVAVQGINLRDVRRIPIAKPPRTEADEIAKRLEAIDSRRSAEQGTIAKLRLLKQGLMEDLISGRVRVTSLLKEATA
ncbi:MAG: restriction endonuclease subunit S [bacterium]